MIVKIVLPTCTSNVHVPQNIGCTHCHQRIRQIMQKTLRLNLAASSTRSTRKSPTLATLKIVLASIRRARPKRQATLRNLRNLQIRLEKRLLRKKKNPKKSNLHF